MHLRSYSKAHVPSIILYSIILKCSQSSTFLHKVKLDNRRCRHFFLWKLSYCCKNNRSYSKRVKQYIKIHKESKSFQKFHNLKSALTSFSQTSFLKICFACMYGKYLYLFICFCNCFFDWTIFHRHLCVSKYRSTPLF